MAIGEYRGVNGVARKITKEYRGVDAVARRIIRGYRGVDGVARKYLDSHRWWFQTAIVPLEGYPNATATADVLSAGWEGASIALRVTAKASANDQIRTSAIAHLYDDFTAGGTMEITFRSSADPIYVDKNIEYDLGDGIGSWSNIGSGSGTFTRTVNIPVGTVRIKFVLAHHSVTKSEEYFIIDHLVINGKTYI